MASIPGGVAMAMAAGVDRRQEWARFCSRRDADGGGSEKGAMMMVVPFISVAGGVEEGGGRCEAATRWGKVGDVVGD
jgi:hypothetical protein